MKDLIATLEAALGERFKHPFYLVSIELTDAVTLRYSATKKAVGFPAGGAIWSAKGFGFSGLKAKSAQRVVFEFNDGTQELATFQSMIDFRGKWIELQIAFYDLLADEEGSLKIFRGQIQTTRRDAAQFSISAFRSGSLKRKTPRRVHGRGCGFQPGGPECNYTGLFDNESAPFKQQGAAAVSGDGMILTDAARGEAADYWNFGTIEIDAGGFISERRVIDFSSGALALDSPVSGAVDGDQVAYVLRRGCDQTWDACRDLLAYGPSGDNQGNYGGFLHLETEARNL